MAQKPVYLDNPMTRMMDRAAQRNESRREVPIETGTSPAVRSAAVGREVDSLPPLTDSERAELDAKAQELGILPPAEGTEGLYATMEEAIKAGAAVEKPATVPDRRDLSVAGAAGDSRMTAREVMSREYARLPDFKKVGGINLILDELYVDGMAFPLPKADADEFRLYAIQIANAAIVNRLNEAVAALTGLVSRATEEVPSAGADTVAGDVAAAEAVQQVPGDEATQ